MHVNATWFSSPLNFIGDDREEQSNHEGIFHVCGEQNGWSFGSDVFRARDALFYSLMGEILMRLGQRFFNKNKKINKEQGIERYIGATRIKCEFIKQIGIHFLWTLSKIYGVLLCLIKLISRTI